MELVFGTFSCSLLIAGLSSTPAGLLINQFGGRFVIATGSLLSGAGLIGLSQVQLLWQYYTAWTVLGVGMALVFYEAAFATINRAWTYDARSGISAVTLIAGFASTVFWPLNEHPELLIVGMNPSFNAKWLDKHLAGDTSLHGGPWTTKSLFG